MYVKSLYKLVIHLLFNIFADLREGGRERKRERTIHQLPLAPQQGIQPENVP